MFEHLRWSYYVFILSSVSLSSFLLWSFLSIRDPASCQQSSIITRSRIRAGAFSAGEARFCHVTDRCTRSDENSPARPRPPGCLLFYKTSAQTVSPISDWSCCSSPLIVPPAAPLSSVCVWKKYTQWNTAITQTLIPIDNYSFHEELENLFFFLLIPWIICSLCINHRVPSGMCIRRCVRNSHSDLN